MQHRMSNEDGYGECIPEEVFTCRQNKVDPCTRSYEQLLAIYNHRPRTSLPFSIIGDLKGFPSRRLDFQRCLSTTIHP
jgi:hypothetical protein